ncbi:MAG: phage integrase SAM-like domain-containing protein [Fuerstiella sp.]|nr:phage integrase SAM-like domain-containing protein [Fuerstiella sp.]
MEKGVIAEDETKLTVTQFFDEYMKDKLAEVKARTVGNYRSTQQKFEEHIGGDTELCDVAEDDVRQFMKSVRHHKSSTIKN